MSIPALALFERVITDTANGSTTATCAAKSGSWLSNRSTDSTIKRSRDTLHLAMNILHAVMDEGIPLPDKLLFQFRHEHETLTSLADKIDKVGATVNLFSPDGLFKSVKLNVDAHGIERRAETLRYKIQRASDIAKSLGIGKGALLRHRLNSTFSLVSITSTNVTDHGATTNVLLVREGMDEVRNEQEHAAELQSIREEVTSEMRSETTTSTGSLSNVESMTITVKQEVQDTDLPTEEDEHQDSQELRVTRTEIVEIVLEPNPWCN